jgi:hypothetical protein
MYVSHETNLLGSVSVHIIHLSCAVLKYGYNSLDFETYLNDTLVFVDNVAHANNDLIASHIVTCFLASSGDKLEGCSSTIGSG